MKNYSSRTKESSLQSYKQNPLIRAVFAVVVALVLVRVLGGTIGAMSATFITAPLAHVRTYFETSGAVLPLYVRDRAELITLIENLREELATQSGDNATILRLTGENEELRALLGSHGETRILAGVIGRPPLSPYDVLYLDRGARDGIKERAIVYHARDQVIGFVSAVYEKSSLVTLFSTPGVDVTAYLFGPNIYVHGYGEGGGVIRLSIPQGVTVEEGDVAVMPSIVPGSLGVVSSVVSVASQPEQHAFVTLSAPLQSLHYVSVGTDVIEPISYEEAAAHVEALSSELFTVDVPAESESTSTPTTTVPTTPTTTHQ